MLRRLHGSKRPADHPPSHFHGKKNNHIKKAMTPATDNTAWRPNERFRRLANVCINVEINAAIQPTNIGDPCSM
jgi:hypothetical protein